MKNTWNVLAVAVLSALILVGCESASVSSESSPTPSTVATPVQPEVVTPPTPEVIAPVVNTEENLQERSTLVAQRLQEKYPDFQILGVFGLPGTDFFEFRIPEYNGFTNFNVDYVVAGGFLYVESDTPGQPRNVSQENNDALAFHLLSQLPFDQALKYTYGAGERSLIMFSDPDCGFCREFETMVATAGEAANLELTVMPMPLTENHPEALAKAQHLLCTANPEATWKAWMTGENRDWASFAAANPATEGCERGEAVAQILRTTQALRFNQTPTLLFSNGQILQESLNFDQLNEALTAAETAREQGVGLQRPE